MLRELGRTKESVEFCKKWMQKEPGNVVAATSGVYAYISTKEYDAAETLVDRFIINKSECLDENDMMFIAASKLYKAMGKKKEKREIDKAIKKYYEYMEEYIEQYFMNPDFEEDDELPFNQEERVCHGASAVWKMDAKYGRQFSVGSGRYERDYTLWHRTVYLAHDAAYESL